MTVFDHDKPLNLSRNPGTFRNPLPKTLELYMRDSGRLAMISRARRLTITLVTTPMRTDALKLPLYLTSYLHSNPLAVRCASLSPHSAALLVPIALCDCSPFYSLSIGSGEIVNKSVNNLLPFDEEFHGEFSESK